MHRRHTSRQAKPHRNRTGDTTTRAMTPSTSLVTAYKPGDCVHAWRLRTRTSLQGQAYKDKPDASAFDLCYPCCIFILRSAQAMHHDLQCTRGPVASMPDAGWAQTSLGGRRSQPRCFATGGGHLGAAPSWLPPHQQPPPPCRLSALPQRPGGCVSKPVRAHAVWRGGVPSSS